MYMYTYISCMYVCNVCIYIYISCIYVYIYKSMLAVSVYMFIIYTTTFPKP